MTEIRIDQRYPSVFISFDHAGKREPLKKAESNDGIWLRLHNNTKVPLFFPIFGVPEPLGQMGMFYEIIPASKETPPEVLPWGYSVGHLSSAYLLEPGGSVLFSVPREHLPKAVALRISFNYAWELDEKANYVRKGEPQHYVLFYSSSIPQ